jgi:hypothetical protein
MWRGAGKRVQVRRIGQVPVWLPLVAALVLSACPSAQDVFDLDGDQWPDDVDCDPQDADVYPFASDSYGDGIDQDCDGADGRDRDGDGHASIFSGGGDCNDADPDVHPGAIEEPDDGVDNDCVDGDLLCDADGDGLEQAACGGDDCDDLNAHCGLDCTDADADGVPLCAGDCDDADPERLPGAEERCNGLDDDCDGETPSDELDLDQDGARLCDPVPDCAEGDPDRFPGNSELCDGVDGDCDPGTWAGGDEGDGDGDGDLACADCADDDPTRDSLDADGDGVTSCDGDCDDGDPAFHPDAPDWAGDGADTNCDGPPGVDFDADTIASTESGGTDCDDEDPSIGPGWAEICDGVDQDCDGDVDEDFDLDGDGVATCAGDCDDADATVHLGAAELCDGLDGDCDGLVPADEVDADSDGFLACAECDDGDPGVSPAAVEVCDGDDEDCDGATDDGFDQDVDGQTTCAGDCDDANPLVHAGAAELCDGLDSDCDPASTPEGGEGDGDGDGHVPCAGYVEQGAGFVGGDDCDDDQPYVFPGAYEYCDGLDNDCDPVTAASWGEADADGDGHLACAAFVDHGASGPGGPLLGGLDCDDGNPARHAAAAEVCDGWDNDCDLASPGETDADEDRYLACAGFVDQGALNPAGEPLLGADDCADDQQHRFPGNPEVCDGLDNDCDPATDGLLDEDDGDGDGWLACEDYEEHGGLDLLGAPLAGGEDCDDADGTSNPGLEAVWEDPDDGVDSGCDGFDANRLGSAVVDRALVGDPSSATGSWVSPGGDIDGDGFDDLVIGAPYDDQNATSSGKVFVLFGSTLNASAPGADVAPDVVLVGSDQWDLAGQAAVGGGDVDGDGLDDVLVVVPRHDEPAQDSGALHVVLGADIAGGGTWTLEEVAHATLEGENGSDSAGGDPEGSLAFAGDVDGDGLDDVLVGAPAWTSPAWSTGRAYLVLGSAIAPGGVSSLSSAHVRFTGEHSNSRGGSSVAGAGDVDGDGLDDVLVAAHFWGSAPNQVGKTYLFLAADLQTAGERSMGAAHATFVGEEQGDLSGFKVASAGDVDGDSLPELLVTTKSADTIYLVSGATAALGGVSSLGDAWAVFEAENEDDRLGYAAASAGDVDGDGLADILLGAYFNDDGGSGAGKAYLFFGLTLAGGGSFVASEADLALVGEHRSAGAGWAVCTAGDVDGDGLDDLAIGARGNQSGGTGAGKVHVLYAP